MTISFLSRLQVGISTTKENVPEEKKNQTVSSARKDLNYVDWNWSALQVTENSIIACRSLQFVRL